MYVGKKYTRSDEVRNRILNMLLYNRGFESGTKLPSIRQIVQYTHFSYVTVWKAMKRLEQDGYISSIPNSGYYAATNLQGQDAGESGVRTLYFFTSAHPLELDTYHEDILSMLAKFTEQKHWRLQVGDITDPGRFEQACHDSSAEAILLPTHPSHPLPELSGCGGIRIICYGMSPNPEYPSVQLDNYRAGEIVAEYLWRQGHRHIYFLRPPRRPNRPILRHFLERFHGISDFYLSKGGMPPKQLEWDLPHHIVGRVLQQLQYAKQRKTHLTLAVGNYSMAMEVYDAARKMDLSIPDDVSIVSFVRRNTREGESLINGMDFSRVDMGQALIALLNFPRGLNIQIQIPQKFYDRGSVKKLSAPDVPSVP